MLLQPPLLRLLHLLQQRLQYAETAQHTADVTQKAGRTTFCPAQELAQLWLLMLAMRLILRPSICNARPHQRRLTLSPATFQLRMRHALASSASGGGRMLASQAGPAGALGLAGARLALGLAALAALGALAPPSAGAASLAAAAAAAAGLAAAASSGGAVALRLGALLGRDEVSMRMCRQVPTCRPPTALQKQPSHPPAPLFSHGGPGGASGEGAEGKLGLGAARQQGQHARCSLKQGSVPAGSSGCGGGGGGGEQVLAQVCTASIMRHSRDASLVDEQPPKQRSGKLAN